MMLMQTRPTPRRRPAFTLLELLIVIGIIALLTVLGFSLAGKVTGRGKVGATTDTLKLLDQALTAYIEAEGGNPPAWVVDPRANNRTDERMIQPVADARNMSGPNEPINSVGLFMVQCGKVSAADAMLKQIDPKFLREFDPDGPGNDNNYAYQISLATVFDAWDRPIRYVHPKFKGQVYGPTYINQTTPASGLPVNAPEFLGVGAPGKQWGMLNIRRSAGASERDADGGVNPAARPYFYSAGPDGDPSTVDDNVYLVAPRTQN